MNISDVVKKIGLISKVIWFYEEKGLVMLLLCSENGYCIYMQKYLNELMLL